MVEGVALTRSIEVGDNWLALFDDNWAASQSIELRYINRSMSHCMLSLTCITLRQGEVELISV